MEQQNTQLVQERPPADLPSEEVRREELPRVIQGGMGVGVSSWQLARAVSLAGQLGVVSGTALDTLLARRLQDGDVGGHMRRALAEFPDQEMAQRVLDKYFKRLGRSVKDGHPHPYRPVPKLTLKQTPERQELAVVANFVEVWLAKEGHDGEIGINFLEKIQMATPAAAFGAMLAGVDYVLMGAGVPREIPRLLDDLAKGNVGGITIDVHGSDQTHRVEVDPRALLGDQLDAIDIKRPKFLAIVSANVLAAYLARDEATRPDGFVVEGHLAGGHNAPPRSKATVEGTNEPQYGPRDEVDLEKIASLGLPFWVAGGQGSPERLDEAMALGAAGVQVGTLFAFAEESGLTQDLRDELRGRLRDGTLDVRTDPLASPTGFPFKVAQIPETSSDLEVLDARPRLCDLSYLRVPFQTPGGDIGYRCPGEPVHMYLAKGGDEEDTVGRTCICNALTADIGLGQTRTDGYAEPALVTLGSDLDGARDLVTQHPDGWTAGEVVSWLTRV